MKHLFKLVSVLLFAAASAGVQCWPLTYSAPEIRARVADEATGEALAGAVVFVQWVLNTEQIGGGHGWRTQYEFETTTGPDGTFVLPAWGPQSRLGYAHFEYFVPQFRIFKPGYVARLLSNERRVNPDSSIINSEWNGKTILLRPIGGDAQQYARSILNVWAGHSEECLRSCPRLVLSVYSEWERISPSLPKDFFRTNLPPPPFRSLKPDDRVFLEHFRDTQK